MGDKFRVGKFSEEFLVFFFDLLEIDHLRFLCREPFAELLHLAYLIHKLFLASVERMAPRAYFNVNGGKRGAYFKSIAARARHLGFWVIGWMDIFFHILFLS